MDSILKKFLYTSVGFVSIAGEKMTKMIEELIEDGKLSKEEGKSILDDFLKSSESRKEEFEETFKNLIDKTIENLRLAKNQDIEEIKTRIDNLEKLVKEKQKKKTEEKKPTTKTTTTRKTTTAKKTTTRKTTPKKTTTTRKTTTKKTPPKKPTEPKEDK